MPAPRTCHLSALLGLAVAAAPACALAGGPPQVVEIPGDPLTIRIGDDHSHQVLHTGAAGGGQFFPGAAAGTGDAGWLLVVIDGGKRGADDAPLGTRFIAGPDFANHPGGTATAPLGPVTPYADRAISGPTGDGSAATPFEVTVTARDPVRNITTTERIRYVNGDPFYTSEFRAVSAGGFLPSLYVTFAGDFHPGGTTDGIATHDPASSTVGTQPCSDAVPAIALTPLEPVDAFKAGPSAETWVEIGSGPIDGIITPGCIDSGGALQWSAIALDGGEAVGGTVAIAVDVPSGPVPFDIVSVVPASGVQGTTVPVTIRGTGFVADVTFDFGAGIAVGGVAVVDEQTATATLQIDPTAAPGPRDATGALDTKGGASATLPDAFRVVAAAGGDPIRPVPTGGVAMWVLMVLALTGAALRAWRRAGT